MPKVIKSRESSETEAVHKLDFSELSAPAAPGAFKQQKFDAPPGASFSEILFGPQQREDSEAKKKEEQAAEEQQAAAHEVQPRGVRPLGFDDFEARKPHHPAAPRAAPRAAPKADEPDAVPVEAEEPEEDAELIEPREEITHWDDLEEELEQERQRLEEEMHQKLDAERQRVVEEATAEARAGAENLIAEAEENRKKLLEQAQEEGAEIKKNAYSQGFSSGEEEGYKEGYQVGYQKGKKTSVEEMKSALAALRDSVEKVNAERGELLKKAEPEILKLSLSVAQKIIHQQIMLDPSTVLAIVQDALKRVDYKRRFLVRVNPLDFDIVKANKDKLEGLVDEFDEFKIISDSKVGAGGCMVETESGVVDSTIETQFKEIEKTLMDVIEGEE